MADPIKTENHTESPSGKGSFRLRLTAVFLLFSTAMIAVSLFGAYLSAQSAVQAKIGIDFEKTVRVLDETFKMRIRSFRNEVTAALADPIFRSRIGEAHDSGADFGLGGDGDLFERNLKTSHQIFSSADLPLFKRHPLLIIVNSEGRLIFSKASPKSFGDDLAHVPVIARSLRQGSSEDLWSGSDGGLTSQGILPDDATEEVFLVMSQSVLSGGETLGAVIAGYALTGRVLPEMANAFPAEVVLFARGGNIAGTPSGLELFKKHFSGRHRAIASGEWPPMLPESSGGFRASSIESTDGFMTRTVKLKEEASEYEIGKIFLFESLSEQMSPFRKRIQWLSLVLFLLTAACGTLVSWLLSTRISSPLTELEAAARQVHHGDLRASVSITSNDEFGRLGSAFNEMVDGLRNARKDPLTGAFNRKHLLTILESETGPGGLLKRPIACVFLDLDHFKAVNDTHGHAAGDYCLIEFCNLVRKANLREEDVFVRYGGEEFVLVLPSMPLEEAARFAEKIRSTSENHPYTHEGTVIKITVSIGVAVSSAGINTAEALMKAADDAAYESKRGGRNRVTVAAKAAA